MVLIKERDYNAVSGSNFINNNMNVNRNVREQNILNELLNGNLPDFLRNFVPINVSNGIDSITYLVTSDYLSIGSDDDYLRIPMNPITAQKIADQYDCTLPTRKMVNDIWKQSEYKLEPLPWGAPFDASMMSSYRFQVHNDRINKQLIGKDKTKLISGHKKDVILSNKIHPNNPNQRVVIYGWIKQDGIPIQGLNFWSHEITYQDYAHGVRLIAQDVMVNNSPMRMNDVFQDTNLSVLVSDEGPLNFLRY